jgi:predicted AAA+ superfamily ATPase
VARQIGISVDFARACFSHLEEAFLVHFLPAYSLKAAERARNPQKVHAVDTGLRNVVCISASPDRGRLAETAVVAAMRRLENDGLYYWKAGREVDVVLRRANAARAAVQVCFDASDAAVMAREADALAAATERGVGVQPILVVRNVTDRGTVALPRGTRVVPLWQFLLDPPVVA